MALAAAPQAMIGSDWRGFKVMRRRVECLTDMRPGLTPAASKCHRRICTRHPLSLQVVLSVSGQEYHVSGLRSQLTADLVADVLTGELCSSIQARASFAALTW